MAAGFGSEAAGSYRRIATLFGLLAIGAAVATVMFGSADIGANQTALAG